MNIQNLSLTDFAFDELNWLYLTLEEKKKDHDTKFELIETMDESQLKYDLFAENAVHYAKCTQWMTKVSEAQKYVRTREIMQSGN